MNAPAETSSNTSQTKPNDAQIAQLAYQKWEEQGQPGGRDQEFWLQAEKQLLSEPKQRQSQLVQPLNSPKIESPAQNKPNQDQKSNASDGQSKASLDGDAVQRTNKPAKPSRRF